jgi:nitroreductase
VLIASGEAKERFRKAIYAEAMSGAGDDHDFTPPREYLGVYLERRRESGFQLYNTLGIVRGDKMAYARQALENYNFFGAPHVAIIHTDEPLGIYGAIDCGAYVGNFMLAAQALGLGTIPQAALARHSGVTSSLPTTAAWSAAFRSALPTMRTRSTATGPRARAWPIP